MVSASTTSIETGKSKLFCSVRVAVTTTGESEIDSSAYACGETIAAINKNNGFLLRG